MPPTDLDTINTRQVLDPALQAILCALQGNILKGHGREHAVYIFVRLVADAATARKAVKALAQQVTSASTQYEQTRDYKQYEIPGDTFMNLMLSARGYVALGFSAAAVEEAFPEPEEPIFKTKARFKAGMRESARELNDPAPDQWEATYRADVHLLIVLADDDQAHLQRQARATINFVRTVGVVVGIEQGSALYDRAGRGIEHFGYADGRSQPIFLESDLPGEGDIDQWNPLEPLKTVLVPDGFAKHDANAFGSYYVFRKLEQNVAGFLKREAELGELLGQPELAGALTVGRFRDGTPVLQSQVPLSAPAPPNNFRYDGEHAARCPFHAHIRKSGPRGDTVKLLGASEALERSRRIARRGIPYGARTDVPPTQGVGLLFACFQASIANQFAFIQAHWINAAGFVPNAGGAPGQDPIVANAIPGETVPQRWPAVWGEAGVEKEFELGHFVHMKGGEFFFAPSLSFFNTL